MRPPDAEPTATDTTVTDRELWRRAAEGSQRAFGDLFLRHGQAVWNQAYRLTGSWSLAEDLTSATFLTAWRKRTSLVLDRDSALPWLYTVLSNLARDEYRGARRRLRLLHRVPAPTAVADHADSVVDQLHNEQRVKHLARVVRRLPAAQRRTVELCLFAGLPPAEAAAALGITETTVRAHLSRARARLREILEDHQ